MAKSYFYVFSGDNRIILTLENFSQYETFILFSFGQAAHFLEDCGTDLEQKLLQLHQVENAPDIQTGALLLAKYALSCQGYNRLDLRKLFEGSTRDYMEFNFKTIFGFTHSQEFTIQQKYVLTQFDWSGFENQSRSLLGRKIPPCFSYGDRQWVIPSCYDL